MSSDNQDFGFPGIFIPAEVLFNPELRDSDQKLFGFIQNLAHSKEGCFAGNEFLADKMNMSVQAISNGIARLRKYHYILVYHEGKGDHSKSNKRHIFINPEYKKIYFESVLNYLQKDEKYHIPNIICDDEHIPNIICAYTKNYSIYNKNIEGEDKNPPPPTSSKEKKKKIPRKYEIFSRKIIKIQMKEFPNLIKEKDIPKRVIKSAETIDMLCRVDGFDFETEIVPVIEWAITDDFWSSQLMSLGALRKKSRKNDEIKFVNVYNSYKQAMKKNNNGSNNGNGKINYDQKKKFSI